MNVRLYTTLGCHLCDDALAMLNTLLAQGKPLKLNEIEIADCEELMAQYGLRIPVITSDFSEGDISWPLHLKN